MRRNRLPLACSLALCLSYALAPATAQTTKLTSGGATFTLPTFENELLQEINFARTRPQEYAAFLEQLRPGFKGKTFRLDGGLEVTSQEGTAALDEAISFLKAARPLAPLGVSPGMTLGASAHVTDQGTKGLFGHKGTDGSLCDQRLARFGRLTGAVGENLSYGKYTARQRVLAWLIDDGFATRGHRLSIFNQNYKLAGLACGNHSQRTQMCVVTFATGFAEKSAGGAQSF